MVFNIRRYNTISMQEKNEFGLVIASSKLEAKIQLYLNGLLVAKKHKDDLSSLEMLINYYDCELIKKIGIWEIELISENNIIEKNNYKDQGSYQKIDLK